MKIVLRKKTYGVRMNDEEMGMVEYLRREKMNLPEMIRNYIKSVYEDTISPRDLDEDVYGL